MPSVVGRFFAVLFANVIFRIMRLIDTRFAGMAQGVGSVLIVGRVHLAQVKIGLLTLVLLLAKISGNTFFPCTFTILDSKKGSRERNRGKESLVGEDQEKMLEV